MTTSLRHAVRVLFVLAALAAVTDAGAQPGEQEVLTLEPARRPAQGVAVLALGGARDEAFALARAVYASSLRPRRLDELHARILAGDPAPPASTKELRELAELRAAVTGDDAASRRLLASIAQQLDVQALLVVSRAPAPPSPPSSAPPEVDAGAPATLGGTESAPPEADAGAPTVHGGRGAVDPGAAPAGSLVSARLFLADTGELDAARYEPDASGWRGTVVSLSSRFPPPRAPATAQLHVPPPKLSSEGKGSRPFYASPWLWGALGAAALVGGFIFFASRDTGDDPIHLQMRVPR